MKEVIINLNDSEDASAFKIGNLIHQKEFNRAVGLIDSGIEYTISNFQKLKNSTNSVKNNTISVIGGRGTGKTSFISSLMNYYKYESKHKESIQYLEIIDPTMIEEKGHIFLTVIAIINDKVRLEISDNMNKLREWEDALNSLSSGLPSLDGIGSNGYIESDWQDPEFIMYNGLKSVNSAFNLAHNFNKFLRLALENLGKSCFLITFDDIDVDFRKGWPILEMIRKYFTSDYLITIASGDIHLFSLSIRKNKWQNFGKALLINEAENNRKKSEFKELVTEMENQYLLKVLKPERRLNLQSLKQRILEKQNIFNVNLPDSKKKQDIITIYNNVLAQFGIVNPYQTETYRNFLLSLPIRSQLQFLKITNQTSGNIQTNDLLIPFLSNLYEKGVDVNFIENNPKLINISVLTLLLKETELSSSYQLMPTTKDGSLNSSLLALNLYSSINTKYDAYLIFDYFIKVGYTRNLLSKFPYKRTLNPSIVNNNPTIHELFLHSGILQDKVLRDIVGNINAFIDAFNQKNKSEYGLIRIDALSLKNNRSKLENENRLDSILSDPKVSKTQEILGYLPFTINESSKSNQSWAVYSIYTLLGSIGELFRKLESGILEKGLIELSQVRTYIMPANEFGQGKISKTILLKEVDKSKKASDFSALVLVLEDWMNHYKGLNSIAIHLLGKISTRFFYALDAIEKIERNSKLGLKMHRRIVALFNAVLYEDAIENLEIISSFNNNNPITEDKIFISNLRSAINSKENSKLVFSKWFLSCPILLSYLNSKSNILDSIYDFTSSSNKKFVQENSIFYILDREKSGNKTLNEDKIIIVRNADIYDLMKKKKVSINLFKVKNSRIERIKANKKIKEVILDKLGLTWSTSKINNFRNYLIKNAII